MCVSACMCVCISIFAPIFTKSNNIIKVYFLVNFPNSFFLNCSYSFAVNTDKALRI